MGMFQMLSLEKGWASGSRDAPKPQDMAPEELLDVPLPRVLAAPLLPALVVFVEPEVVPGALPLIEPEAVPGALPLVEPEVVPRVLVLEEVDAPPEVVPSSDVDEGLLADVPELPPDELLGLWAVELREEEVGAAEEPMPAPDDPEAVAEWLAEELAAKVLEALGEPQPGIPAASARRTQLS